MNPWYEIHWLGGKYSHNISLFQLKRLMLDYRLRANFAFGLFVGWDLISPHGKYVHALLRKGASYV